MMYRYWLNNIEALGNVTIKKLLLYFGTSRNIYEATQQQLREAEILSMEQLAILMKSKKQLNNNMKQMKENTQKWMQELEQKQIHYITLEQEEYPDKLRNIDNSPLGIYYKGKLPTDTRPLAAIVGARACSAYGRYVTEGLSKALVACGYDIISGMARGIDTAAHQGCLKADGVTHAVFGCSVDICYPRENYKLYDDILQKGSIISESPPPTAPLAQLFPSRNRIISGMADLVIVVEARSKSGSLITADFALEQGKDIYVVPGRITDNLSSGCNGLIAQGAGIICSVEQFIQDITELPTESGKLRTISVGKQILLEKEESLVYSCFDFYPKSIDEVLNEINMDLIQLLSIIVHLTELGLIQECFKNQYIRLR